MRPAAGRQCGRGGRRQPARHAPSLQTGRCRPQDRVFHRGRRRQHRTHHHPRAWAAAGSRSPSPDRAAIVGAITASAIHSMRFAARSRCSPTRASTGPPKSAINVGSDRRRIERQRDRPVGPRQGGYPVGKQCQDGRVGGTPDQSPSSAPATSRTSAPPAGKVTVKLREIGSRPAAALPDQAPILQYVRAVDAHLGIRVAPGYLVDRCQHPAVAGNSGGCDRGGRGRRRRAYHPGMVPPGRPRPGTQTDLPDPANADAQCGTGGSGAVNRRKADLGLLFNTVVWGATFVLVKVRSRRYLPDPVSGAAFLAGRRWRCCILLRGRCAACSLPGRPLAAGSLAGVFPVCRLCLANLGAPADHRAEVGLSHRADVRAGTFARGARL